MWRHSQWLQKALYCVHVRWKVASILNSYFSSYRETYYCRTVVISKWNNFCQQGFTDQVTLRFIHRALEYHSNPDITRVERDVRQVKLNWNQTLGRTGREEIRGRMRQRLESTTNRKQRVDSGSGTVIARTETEIPVIVHSSANSTNFN